MQATVISPAALDRVIESSLGVDPAYRHITKQVTSEEPMELPSAVLKWYAVHPGDRPVPTETERRARQPLESGDLQVQGLGFVVLHRCGNDFYFLIVCTWRNENELWQTVWYKDGDRMDAFAPFRRELPHIPTYCVWELVPVWYEQQAWTRFLLSARDGDGARAWVADRYEGPA